MICRRGQLLAIALLLVSVVASKAEGQVSLKPVPTNIRLVGSAESMRPKGADKVRYEIEAVHLPGVMLTRLESEGTGVLFRYDYAADQVSVWRKGQMQDVNSRLRDTVTLEESFLTPLIPLIDYQTSWSGSGTISRPVVAKRSTRSADGKSTMLEMSPGPIARGNLTLNPRKLVGVDAAGLITTSELQMHFQDGFSAPEYRAAFSDYDPTWAVPKKIAVMFYEIGENDVVSPSRILEVSISKIEAIPPGASAMQLTKQLSDGLEAVSGMDARQAAAIDKSPSISRRNTLTAVMPWAIGGVVAMLLLWAFLKIRK